MGAEVSEAEPADGFSIPWNVFNSGGPASILNANIRHTPMERLILMSEERSKKLNWLLEAIAKEETTEQKQARAKCELKYAEEARVRREAREKAHAELMALGITLLCDDCNAPLEFTKDGGRISIERCDCRDEYCDY